MATVDHAAILEALQRGESQKSVARRLGYGVATVNRIAKRNGVEPVPWQKVQSSPEVMAAAADYCLERRIVLLNKIFDKAEAMIDAVQTPHQLQALAISAGILIDKRRLEDGDVTARTEVNGGGARERLARSLDELAARRRARAAS